MFYQSCWKLYLLVDHALFFSLLFVCDVCECVYVRGEHQYLSSESFHVIFSVVWFGFVLLMEFADSTRRADCFKDISTYLRTWMRIKEDRDGGSLSLCEQAHERRYIFCQEQLKSSDFYIRMQCQKVQFQTNPSSKVGEQL